MNMSTSGTGLLARLQRAWSRRRRRTQLYCVGLGKSGTHSLAAMFAARLRTAHEPESGRVIDLVLARAHGQISEQEFRRQVLERDRRLRLEVDSSALNISLLDALVPLFGNARFLLTLRHPESWLDSFLNHQLARPTTPRWERFREFRFRPQQLTHPPEEAVLKSRGLYTLDAYLGYWAGQTREVLTKVPPDRLLVVRTDQITARAADIARFARVPEDCADASESKKFPATAQYGLLSQLDARYLDAKLREHCGELIDRYFVTPPPSSVRGADGDRSPQPAAASATGNR